MFTNGLFSIFEADVTEVKCLPLTSSRREMCMSSISDAIYHKFSHMVPLSIHSMGKTLTLCKNQQYFTAKEVTGCVMLYCLPI